MPHPSHREDLSRFLVHLTRDVGEQGARDNLISILRDQTIAARNPHCLFHHEFSRLGFSGVLKKRFNTVCFTETPLIHLQRLTGEIPGRRVELKEYGLVFAREDLIKRGASPAIYLNAKGTKLREYLLSRFRVDFKATKEFKALKKTEAEHHESIVRYYSLINIIAENYDFTWEREWRHNGNLSFRYRDIVAIVAAKPESFRSYCKKQLTKDILKYIDRLPIVSPTFSYEDVVEAMSIKIWNDAAARKKSS
jgi:hypothetical protein